MESKFGNELNEILLASKNISNNDQAAQNQIDSNYWQTPVTDFGSDTIDWPAKMRQHRFVGEIEFSLKEWARATRTVDEVMKLLLKEMKVQASSYEHLRIDSYVRQGSARNGLKVIKPDEFDTILEFHIEDLTPAEAPVEESGRIHGYCYLQVNGSSENLEQRYPALFKRGVFVSAADKLFLSSQALHQGVFQSIIDKSVIKLEEQINSARETDAGVIFSIQRAVHPPALCLTIHVTQDAQHTAESTNNAASQQEGNFEIYVDIVPALCLRADMNESVLRPGQPMNAAIHAVCKWREEHTVTPETVDHRRIWHISSAGYETFILDVARTVPAYRRIITGLRVFKTYLSKQRANAKRQSETSPIITEILSSYHLKHIALYLISYVRKYNIDIDSAVRALGFYLTLLTDALQVKKLPNFFFSEARFENKLQFYAQAQSDDLFRKLSPQSMEQANSYLLEHIAPDLGFHINNDSLLHQYIFQDFLKGASQEEYLRQIQNAPDIQCALA